MMASIAKYLSDIDHSIISVNSERDISYGINDLLKECKSEILDNEDKAELFAFEFLEDSSLDQLEITRGEYYQPQCVFEGGNEFPSREEISQAMIDYWAERATLVTNPLLKIRYLDLVMEFGSRGSNDRETANKIIENIMCLIDDTTDIGTHFVITKLRRSLILTKIFNNQLSIKYTDLRTKIVNFEIKTQTDAQFQNLPWGYSFRWFLLQSKDVNNELANQLIHLMKVQISKFGFDTDIGPVEYGIGMLLEFFHKKQDTNEIIDCLRQLENSYRGNIHINSNPFQKVTYLEKLSNLYHHNKPILGEIAAISIASIDRELYENSSALGNSMQEISSSVTLTNSEVSELVESIFGTSMEQRTLSEVCSLIIHHLTVKIDFAEKELLNSYRQFPLQFILSKNILDHNGICIAKIGSIQHNLDQHKMFYCGQFITWYGGIRAMLLSELFQRFSDDEILNTMSQSVILIENDLDKKYLLKIFHHFREKDYLVTNSLLVPYIEDMFRRLGKLTGISTLRLNRKENGYEYCSLETILSNNEIRIVLGNDLLNNIRLILTETMGSNLRNIFCHGIHRDRFYSEIVSSELLFVLMSLSMVQKIEPQS